VGIEAATGNFFGFGFRMKLPIFQVDAFTSQCFAGNPAALILEEDWLADEVLQAIAAENNLSETAFVITHSQPFPLR
jgi:PhzF family phenazine biosynthesis protein